MRDKGTTFSRPCLRLPATLQVHNYRAYDLNNYISSWLSLYLLPFATIRLKPHRVRQAFGALGPSTSLTHSSPGSPIFTRAAVSCFLPNSLSNIVAWRHHDHRRCTYSLVAPEAYSDTLYQPHRVCSPWAPLQRRHTASAPLQRRHTASAVTDHHAVASTSHGKAAVFGNTCPPLLIP